MSIESKKQIDLGFAEECKPGLLRNVYFPSKIGGKPAWLDLDLVPSTDELKCKKCGSPTAFLCQVYAPIEDKAECFHRSIFLFICREPNCFAQNSSENILAFRSQLPRQNKFYSAVPPNEDVEVDPIELPFKTCKACGCRGSLMCSRCKGTNYCSAKHQRADWPQHKLTCGSVNISLNDKESVSLVEFPEFEIAIEQDSAIVDLDLSYDDVEEKKQLVEYQTLVEQGKTGVMSDIPESEFEKYISEEDERVDEYFRQFKKCISGNPEQVLRYDLGGEPLWITDPDMSIGKSAIPACSNCNCERHFEFQIMPQMVNFLKDDIIDWGVLAVYTCKDSCKSTKGYVNEFVLKQDIVSDDNK